MDSYANPPAIVIYIVDAFLGSSAVRSDGGEEEEGDEVEAGSIWLLGLLRCYTEMLQSLPETMRPALVLQVKKNKKNRERESTGENCFSSSSFYLSLCRWCRVSIYSSLSVERATCIYSIFAPWPSPVTPSADVFYPSRHISSP